MPKGPLLRLLLAIIDTGWWLAPPARRREWRRQWRADILHEWQRIARQRDGSTRSGLVIRAAGALRHAFWLRLHVRRLEMITQDIRYGWRLMVRKPAFHLVAVLTLGLGIGANVQHVQLGERTDAPPAGRRRAAGSARRAQRHDAYAKRVEPLVPRLRGLSAAPAGECRGSHRLHDASHEHARGQRRPAARLRRDGLGQLLRGAWGPSVARAAVPCRGRLGARPPRGRGHQPQVLASPLRRRPVHRRPDDFAELDRLYRDRRRPRRVSWHGAVPQPRSLGSAHDAAGPGGRPPPLAQQPVAHRQWFD